MGEQRCRKIKVVDVYRHGAFLDSKMLREITTAAKNMQKFVYPTTLYGSKADELSFLDPLLAANTNPGLSWQTTTFEDRNAER